MTGFVEAKCNRCGRLVLIREEDVAITVIKMTLCLACCPEETVIPHMHIIVGRPAKEE